MPIHDGDDAASRVADYELILLPYGVRFFVPLLGNLSVYCETKHGAVRRRAWV